MRGAGIGTIVVLAVVGCAPEEEDPELTWSGRHAAAACDAMFNRGCMCGLEDIWSSAEACEFEQHMFVRQAQLDAIEAELLFDLACAEAHIDSMESVGCESLAEADAAGTLTYCQIYSGTKSLGEPCTPYWWAWGASGRGIWMSDCEQGLLCTPAGERCVTPEMPFIELAPGEGCVAEDGFTPLGYCGNGSACDDITRTCVMPAALGEPCPNDYPCADSWCDGSTCVARKPDGSSCESFAECESLFCDADSGVCVAPPPSKAACAGLVL